MDFYNCLSKLDKDGNAFHTKHEHVIETCRIENDISWRARIFQMPKMAEWLSRVQFVRISSPINFPSISVGMFFFSQFSWKHVHVFCESNSIFECNIFFFLSIYYLILMVQVVGMLGIWNNKSAEK